jgi:hypothetical protein
VSGLGTRWFVQREPRPDPDPVADLAEARARIDFALLAQAAQLDALTVEVAERPEPPEGPTSRR